MIIHQLIRHHLKFGDDDNFYSLQARDAIRWMVSKGVRLSHGTRVLDLGCGHGIFGRELIWRGACDVTFSDDHPSLRASLQDREFFQYRIGEDTFWIGQYDVVLFSNVYEHLPDPTAFLAQIHSMLVPGGVMFMSWTNWLSPWGGHDFSPFHYLGPRLGPWVFDKLKPGKRQHFPYAGLWPTYIGSTLRRLRRLPGLEVIAVAPRYYTELAWLMRIPILREFLAWNCAVLIRRNN